MQFKNQKKCKYNILLSYILKFQQLHRHMQTAKSQSLALVLTINSKDSLNLYGSNIMISIVFLSDLI